MDGGSIPPISTAEMSGGSESNLSMKFASRYFTRGFDSPHLHQSRMQGVRVLVTRWRVTARGGCFASTPARLCRIDGLVKRLAGLPVRFANVPLTQRSGRRQYAFNLRTTH